MYVYNTTSPHCTCAICLLSPLEQWELAVSLSYLFLPTNPRTSIYYWLICIVLHISPPSVQRVHTLYIYILSYYSVLSPNVVYSFSHLNWYLSIFLYFILLCICLKFLLITREPCTRFPMCLTVVCSQMANKEPWTWALNNLSLQMWNGETN